jgi:hypothetical protein
MRTDATFKRQLNNTTMSDKIYCGRGKRFGKYNTISINICVDDIPKEHITTSTTNGKRYVRLNVDEKKEADPYGNTHTVSVDTWKPDKDKAPAPAPAPKPRYGTNSDTVQAQFDDDLPF